MQFKTCRNCSVKKSVTDFYQMGNAAAGARDCICKECVKAYQKQRALLKQDEISAANKSYNQVRNLTHRETLREQTRKWRAEHPRAYKAQTAVGNAIRDRKLQRGVCQLCANPKAQAHHKDYDRPLDVVWLCSRCHLRIHAVFPELGGHYRGRE